MAKVERVWLRIRAAAQAIEPMCDPALGKDVDFNDLDPALVEADFAKYEQGRLADDAAAPLAFDATFTLHDETYSLRLVYVHMIAEYARHNGHGDLLREAIDATTGV